MNGAIHTYQNLPLLVFPILKKISILYIQVSRVNRICSSKNHFKTHGSRMKEWFLT